VLSEVLPTDAVILVQGRGNLTGALAVLVGLASEESGRPHVRPDDWRFPVVSLARVRKPVHGA
jgi:hypothetical protein